MQVIHQLVRKHGQDRALELVSDKEKYLVPVAARILASETQDIGYTYSGFCMTALPHSGLPPGAKWTHTIETPKTTVTLLVEPGSLPIAGKPVTFDVPFGSRARLILLYLQTRAYQTKSREIEIGTSMRNWMVRMGISTGGQAYKDVREQALRISACQMTFGWHRHDGKPGGFERENIITAGTLGFAEYDPNQHSLWEDRIRLSETFFKALCDHPMPYWEVAIRELRNNSQAIDIYIWLAYRLHHLEQARPVSWTALYKQFGAAYKHIRQFRARFIQSLQLALTVYPEATVNVNKDGLVLHPSRAPIGDRPYMQVLTPSALQAPSRSAY